MFAEALAARSLKVDFLSCLRHSARQFVVRRRDGRAEVLAGYPWYGQIGRQTLVALPGIALEQGRTEDCLDVLDTVVRERRDGMFTGSFRLPRLPTPRFGSSGCFSDCSGHWARRRYGSVTAL